MKRQDSQTCRTKNKELDDALNDPNADPQAVGLLHEYIEVYGQQIQFYDGKV